MAIFFTADTHFFDLKILKYRRIKNNKRLFKSVYQMHDFLIHRWNNVVSAEDTVYHLGDFSLGTKKETESILTRLNGSIILIRGNHDIFPNNYYLSIGFMQIKKQISLETILGPIHLSHRPAKKLSPEEKFCLHGHVHRDWVARQLDNNTIYLNVGVDVWSYRPVNLFYDLASSFI